MYFVNLNLQRLQVAASPNYLGEDPTTQASAADGACLARARAHALYVYMMYSTCTEEDQSTLFAE